MSNGTEDWYHEPEKNAAVYKVLRYLAAHPREGLELVGRDEKARQLFEAVGGIRVPVEKDARVIFFAPGERARDIGASVILEVPPEGYAGATDDELKPFVLGNYEYWPPES